MLALWRSLLQSSFQMIFSESGRIRSSQWGFVSLAPSAAGLAYRSGEDRMTVLSESGVESALRAATTLPVTPAASARNAGREPRPRRRRVEWQRSENPGRRGG